MSNSRKTKGIGTVRGGGALALLGVLAMSYASDEIPPAAQPQPRYAPGVLIVKFKEPVADELKAALVRGEPLHQVSTTASLDALNAKYGLKDMRMLFRSFIVKDADGRITHVETMAEHVANIREKFVVRGRRCPAEYRGPDLTMVFRLQLDRDADIQAAAAAYGGNPDVEYAERDSVGEVCWHPPSDTFYNSSNSWQQPYDDLWGIKRIRCEEAWDISKGSGTIIAIIDTGIWYRVHPNKPQYDGHPDIKQNVWRNYYEYYGYPDYDDDGNGFVDDIWGWNFVEQVSEEHPEWPYSDAEDSADADPMDFRGHGTHVAGTAAAIGNNARGVVGVAPYAKVMAVKVVNRDGGALSSWAAQGILYGTDNGADVLNISLGFREEGGVLPDAVHYAYSQACVLVAAAGNNGIWRGVESSRTAPGNVQKAITVCATGYADDVRSAYSNYGVLVDIAAPGGGEPGGWPSDILSLRSACVTGVFANQNYWLDDPNDPPDEYLYFRAQGTSMASPHVAGAAALILSGHPGMNPEEVRSCIQGSAVDRGTTGFDELYGFGVLDARAALEYAAQGEACQACLLDPDQGAILVRDSGEPVYVDIYGVADSEHWGPGHCWEVHYRPRHDPSGWLPVSSGNSRMYWYYGGYMGTIADPPDGQYIVRLTVYGNGGESFHDYALFSVCTARHRVSYDPPDERGWKKFALDHPVTGAPLIGELSGAHPGKEIFFGTDGRRTYDIVSGQRTEVWRPGFFRALTSGGNTLWEKVAESYEIDTATYYGTVSSATGAELTSSSPLEEILIGTRQEDPDYGLMKARAYSADGETVWEHGVGHPEYANGAALVAAELHPEYPGLEVLATTVVTGGQDPISRVWCLSNDLVNVRWSLDIPGSTLSFSSCAVANMDGDESDLEIALASDAYFHVLKRFAGVPAYYVAWSVHPPEFGYSSPAAADLFPQWTDPKGVVKQTPGCEIVVGNDDGRVRCLSFAARTVCWRYAAGPSGVRSSPAVADLDGDSIPGEHPDLEIVVGCNPFLGSTDHTGRVVCLEADGTLCWSFDTGKALGFLRSSPAIADLDPSHPGLEVAIGDLHGNVYVFHGGTGTLSWWFETSPGLSWDTHKWDYTLLMAVHCSPTVGDITEARSGLQLAAAPGDDYLYIFSFAGTETQPTPWPMFHHDRHHTGWYGYVPEDHEGL